MVVAVEDEGGLPLSPYVQPCTHTVGTHTQANTVEAAVHRLAAAVRRGDGGM